MNSAFDWDIDFDEWCTLASTDPHSFEKQRQHLVDAVIDSVPEDKQLRLRRLQWRIDKVRETSGSPLAACIRISDMMWDAVMGKGGLREALHILSQAEPEAVPFLHNKPKATVLPFRPPCN